ncbi:MAG: phospholipase [Rhodanobacteraceae bacterium]
MLEDMLVVFVHGWSATSTATYGQLPARLKAEADRREGPGLDIRQIYLGEYVSFHDEVRIDDIARAFDAAIHRELDDLAANQRFVCITHSAGGPVVREWLHRYHVQPRTLDNCPMSHLIMLAPANFGSALAQLGKSRIGAIKAWFDGVEPGQGVLDWLELASPESCELNLSWIDEYPGRKMGRGSNPVFQFVLTGDTIDRKLYDFVNSYTGESGSDGVVRVAAANLNASHVVLSQPASRVDEPLPSARKRLRTLELKSETRAMTTAFKIIPGQSHSGSDMGIMASVRNNGMPHPTVEAIMRCLQVADGSDYRSLCTQFDSENEAYQRPAQRLETEHVPVLPDREYIHDPASMLILRLFDSRGTRIPDVDVLMTAGPAASPDQLPDGFLLDRQACQRARGNITFFLNHAVLAGCPQILRHDGSSAREALLPRPPYGLRLQPRHDKRFVEYWSAQMDIAQHDLLAWLRPNETTIIDLHMSRIVHEGVFQFTRQLSPARDFRNVEPGGVA